MKSIASTMLVTYALADPLRREADKRGFNLGAGINLQKIRKIDPNDTQYFDVLNEQFNMSVANNACKSAAIMKEPGVYDYS